MKHKLLVTGCGRSGTSYICSVLGNFKPAVDIGHENRLGNAGMASWLVPFDVPTPRGPQIRLKDFQTILHQVRHPLGTISSLHTVGQESWDFIKKCIPEIAKHKWQYQKRSKVPETQKDQILLAATKYWYYWNLQAEKIASWTYQVEDIQNVLPEFCKRAGIVWSADVFNKAHKTDTRVTRKDYVKITWDDIKRVDSTLYNDVIKLSEKYGY